jgi:hypothetical protein
MCLNTTIEKLTRQSKDGFKGKHFLLLTEQSVESRVKRTTRRSALLTLLHMLQPAINFEAMLWKGKGFCFPAKI